MTIQVRMDIAADHHTVGLAKMIARQAARTPGAPAVLTAEGDWSYQELNAHANRLAHHLIGLGIGPGDLVGVYLNRSPELVSALLAAWKAGAGYVPLDPAQPDRRTGWIVSDTKPAVVLTTLLHATVLAIAAHAGALAASGGGRSGCNLLRPVR